jgi:hypothetical protein
MVDEHLNCSDLLASLPSPHRDALATTLENLISDPDVLAVLLMGSLVRGDSFPGSDLDLTTFVADAGIDEVGYSICYGVVVQSNRLSLDRAHERLLTRPGECYRYLDGRAVYDPQHLLPDLFTTAHTRADGYQMPESDLLHTRYWFMKIRSKLDWALLQQDEVLAGFLVTITTSEILADLFALLSKPPPSTAAAGFARLGDLEQIADVRPLFTGDSLSRAPVAISLIDRILADLPDPSAAHVPVIS